jgi:hypothetical protein
MPSTKTKIVQDPNDPMRFIAVEVEEGDEPLLQYESEQEKKFEKFCRDAIQFGYENAIPENTPVFRESFPREKINRFVKDGRFTHDLSRLVISGGFDCSKLGLTSLKGVPHRINGVFDCSGNELEKFDDFPLICKEANIGDNPLFTLEGLGDKKGRQIGGIRFGQTMLRNLKGLKNVHVGSIAIERNNFFESLEGIPPGLSMNNIRVDFNDNVTGPHLHAQLVWYLEKGTYGYDKYWEDIRDYFFASHKYDLLNSIGYWPNGILSTEQREEIKRRINNTESSKEKINRFNL